MKKETLNKGIEINVCIENCKERIKLLALSINKVKVLEGDLLMTGDFSYNKKEEDVFQKGLHLSEIKGFRAKALLSMLQDERIYNEEKLIKYEKKLEDLKDE